MDKNNLFNALEKIKELEAQVDAQNSCIEVFNVKSNLDKSIIIQLRAGLVTKNNFIQLLNSKIARNKLTIKKLLVQGERHE